MALIKKLEWENKDDDYLSTYFPTIQQINIGILKVTYAVIAYYGFII